MLHTALRTTAPWRSATRAGPDRGRLFRHRPRAVEIGRADVLEAGEHVALSVTASAP